VESPSLEIFQPRLDAVLCPLLWVTLLGQGVGWGTPGVPSNPATLAFCDFHLLPPQSSSLPPAAAGLPTHRGHAAPRTPTAPGVQHSPPSPLGARFCRRCRRPPQREAARLQSLVGKAEPRIKLAALYLHIFIGLPTYIF